MIPMLMHGMGGSTMSMAWPAIGGLCWVRAATSFVVVWSVMMAAMMLPSLAPTLRRYHRLVEAMGVRPPIWETVLFSSGYFGVWSAIGVAVIVLGAVLTAAELRQPAVVRAMPIASAMIVLFAGVLQFTPWKARHLAWCRKAPASGHSRPADTAPAWQHGLHLGIHCSQSCIGLTAAVLAIGIMDLRAMAVATAAITAERLGPPGARVERVIGGLGVGAGLLMLTRIWLLV